LTTFLNAKDRIFQFRSMLMLWKSVNQRILSVPILYSTHHEG